MPLLFYLLLVNILIRAAAGLVRTRREPKPDSLCATCVFVHMQYAVNGKRATSCTFGGGLRPITIDVMYCTDYRDRCARPRVTLVGFAREPAQVAGISGYNRQVS